MNNGAPLYDSFEGGIGGVDYGLIYNGYVDRLERHITMFYIDNLFELLDSTYNCITNPLVVFDAQVRILINDVPLLIRPVSRTHDNCKPITVALEGVTNLVKYPTDYDLKITFEITFLIQ